jgi:hypothetical protein
MNTSDNDTWDTRHLVVSYIALRNKATVRIQILLLGYGVLLFGIGRLLTSTRNSYD